MSEMSAREAYRVLQGGFGARGGDDVKVVRGYTEEEANDMGFTASGMRGEFNRLVGKIVPVVNVGIYHIEIPDPNNEGGGIYAPFFCLELVEKAKPKPPPIMVGGNVVKFLDGKIRVCDVTVSGETLHKMLDRLEN